MWCHIVLIVIDMQLNNRINIKQWPRCREVTLQDGVLKCTLALDDTYDLGAAYKSDLHIRFSNTQTDEELVSFLRSWGPLGWVFPGNQEKSLSLAYCRAFRRWLRALVDVLAAFKRAEGERAALREFIEAEYEKESASQHHLSEPLSISTLRKNFRISKGQNSVADWLTAATLPQIRFATDLLVRFFPLASNAARLSCTRKGGKPQVEAKWDLLSLEEALRWMIWYDEFTQHPIMCCNECRQLFRVDSAHARKFCSLECAHRATARVWARNKREKQRKGGK
jgi:Zn-finger nucleic acid-binding protein